MVGLVPADLLAELANVCGVVDGEEFCPKHGGEVVELFGGDGRGQDGVMRGAGGEPGFG